ncbi:uncharacterized protein LOC144120422 isoform X4 [Amblyomma americanum]
MSATASPDARPEEARAAAQQPAPVSSEAGDGVSDALVLAPTVVASGEEAPADKSKRSSGRTRRSRRGYGEARSREAREEDDEEDRSGHSLLLFVLAAAMLVVCIVAGFVSVALLEQMERRKKQPSIEAPDFD